MYREKETQISDFRFELVAYGRYRVIYQSPVTGAKWIGYVADMSMIDATKNADNPKQKDLDMLKWLCKNYLK